MSHYKNILSLFKIEALNEMQNATVEAIQKPNDIILISPTGSGKTLAFLLPTLQVLSKDKKGVQVLILVPSRELAMQIEQVFKQMATTFKINCCYGGHSTLIEKNNLQHTPAVLVGTPGRIAYHIRKGNVGMHDTRTLILDEFDKALEFGFKEEMAFIIQQCKNIKKEFLLRQQY